MTQQEIDLQTYYLLKGAGFTSAQDIKDAIDEKAPNGHTHNYLDKNTADSYYQEKGVVPSHNHDSIYYTKTEVSNHYVAQENGKGLFSGSYKDLSNKPSFTQDSDITNNTEGRYAIGTLNLDGINDVTLYGKDTNIGSHNHDDTYIEKSGSGNNLVLDNGNTIAKSTFLTEHQSLSDYLTTSQLNQTIYRTFLECSSYNVDINDENGITITVTLIDYNNNIKSGTPVTLSCDKGYFTYSKGLSENTYEAATQTKTIRVSSDSSGQLKATWKPDDWGLVTFQANDTSIQVNVTGWKHYSPTITSSQYVSYADWSYAHFYRKDDFVFLKVQGKNTNTFNQSGNTEDSPNYQIFCTVPTDCRPLYQQHSSNFNYRSGNNVAQGRLTIMDDTSDTNSRKKSLKLHLDTDSTEGVQAIFRLTFSYILND